MIRMLALCIVLLTGGCDIVQGTRPIPPDQRRQVECAWARLNCDPGWHRD